MRPWRELHSSEFSFWWDRNGQQVVPGTILDFASFHLGIILDLWDSDKHRIRSFFLTSSISPVVDITWYHQWMVKTEKPLSWPWESAELVESLPGRHKAQSHFFFPFSTVRITVTVDEWGGTKACNLSTHEVEAGNRELRISYIEVNYIQRLAWDIWEREEERDGGRDYHLPITMNWPHDCFLSSVSFIVMAPLLFQNLVQF